MAHEVSYRHTFVVRINSHIVFVCSLIVSNFFQSISDGKVLGVHEGQIVEYDAETLSPLGIVVNSKELGNREVLVVDNSRALVLVNPETDDMEVIHPNDDGSYWRKYQRNKRVRQEEKAREAAAKLWLERKQEKTTSKT